MREEPEDLVVADVMTRGVICVDVEDTVLSAAQVMERNDISSVIVTKDGEGVGIITERDILSKIVTKQKDSRKVAAKDVMTAPLVTVKPGSSIDDAARLMSDKDIRRLVVAEKDGIVGVLSEFDIVRVEPAMHMLIREKSAWSIDSAFEHELGTVSGVCESCENYAESLRMKAGRMVCDECFE